MAKAPIADLKARLSHYLRRVKAGEEVLITERNIPVARIVPIKRSVGVEAWRDLEEKGLMRLGSGKIPRQFWTMPRGSDARAAVRKALQEDREETF